MDWRDGMLTLEAKQKSKTVKYLDLYLDGVYYRRGALQCFFKHLKSAKEFETKQDLLDWIDQVESHFIQKKAYDYLAKRNYPSSVLKEKLLSLFLDPIKVEKVIQTCIESKYCDDQNWIEQFIDRQLSQGYGPVIIRAKLLQKKLSKDLVQKAIDQITLEEQKISIIKKMQQLEGKKTPEKILGTLQRRGFSLDVLYEIIKIQ